MYFGTEKPYCWFGCIYSLMNYLGDTHCTLFVLILTFPAPSIPASFYLVDLTPLKRNLGPLP